MHVLAPPDREAELRRLILTETGTLGLRRTIIDKLALPRTAVTVEVDGTGSRSNTGPGAPNPNSTLAAAAAALDLPLRVVTARALAALDEPADV